MTYVNCPSCGQKALEVASRCPRCGAPFEAQFSQRRVPVARPHRIPWGLLTAVLVGMGLWMVAARLEQPGTIPVSVPSASVDSVLSIPPGPIRDSLHAAADSLTRDSSPPARASGKSSPSPSNLESPADLAHRDSTATLRRYTTTWVNVRAGRSSRAAVIRVLRPREPVLVGSLEGGWYRVLNQPQAAGFVDGRYLAAAPPTGPR